MSGKKCKCLSDTKFVSNVNSKKTVLTVSQLKWNNDYHLWKHCIKIPLKRSAGKALSQLNAIWHIAIIHCFCNWTCIIKVFLEKKKAFFEERNKDNKKNYLSFFRLITSSFFTTISSLALFVCIVPVYGNGKGQEQIDFAVKTLNLSLI